MVDRNLYKLIPCPASNYLNLANSTDVYSKWLEEAELGLGLWEGEYQGLTRQWLRWYDQENNWLPTPEEREKQRAEQEKQRADLAESELAKLRQLLAEQGINL